MRGPADDAQAGGQHAAKVHVAELGDCVAGFDGGPEEALRRAAETEGAVLPDGRFVQIFLGIEEGEDGFVAQFMTDGEADEDAGV